MRTPTVITSTVLLIAWALVAFNLPLLATAALGFGLFCLMGWLLAAPAQAASALLVLLVFSPPGVAFTMGLSDGFFGEPTSPAAHPHLPGDTLMELPYNAALQLLS
jgi:hypothetical protein